MTGNRIVRVTNVLLTYQTISGLLLGALAFSKERKRTDTRALSRGRLASKRGSSQKSLCFAPLAAS